MKLLLLAVLVLSACIAPPNVTPDQDSGTDTRVDSSADITDRDDVGVGDVGSDVAASLFINAPQNMEAYDWFDATVNSASGLITAERLISEDETILEEVSPNRFRALKAGTGHLRSEETGLRTMIEVVRPSIVTVKAGDESTCVLTSAGIVLCRGANRDGMIGDGTATGQTQNAQPVSELVPVSGLTRFIAIDYTVRSICGIDEIGDAWCWGRNEQQQLVDGGLTIGVPTRVGGEAVGLIEISIGSRAVCGRRQNRELICWGYNESFAVGLGDADQRILPTKLPAPRDHVSLGAKSGYATQGDFAVGWGENGNGNVDPFFGPSAAVPEAQSPVANVKRAYAHSLHSCAIQEDDTVVCWGDTANDVLGGSEFLGGIQTNVTVPNLTASKLTLGLAGTCALSLSSDLVCWGSNYGVRFGQDFATGETVIPPIQGAIIDASLSSNHLCVTTDNGRAYCQGLNNHQQIDAAEVAAIGNFVELDFSYEK